MAYTGLPGQQADPSGTRAVFNPPPGWPAPPPGWEPPPGWQPDPTWPPAPPGWQFWRQPQQAGAQPGAPAGAGQLHVTFDGNSQVFMPGQTVRIGRGTDNDITVGYSSVSRRHAQVTFTPGGWVFENVGQAPTYAGTQPVTRLTVTQPTDLTLGSAHGPVLHLAPGPGNQRTVTWNNPGQGGTSGQWPGSPGSGQWPGGPGPGGPGPGQWPGSAAPGQWPGGPGPGQWAGGPQFQRANNDVGEAVGILFPIRSWLSNPGWHQGVRLMVVIYALLPLVFIALFQSSTDLSTPGWAYALYVAPLWALGFWWLIRPGPIRKLEIQVAAGIVVWTFVWLYVVTINVNDAIAGQSQSLSIPTALAVGYNEEITKALPVFLAGIILLRARKTKLDARMWMFFGTLAGLTFGVAEAALYTARYLSVINTPQGAGGAVQVVLLFAERVFVDGFQHAIWAGISGFFIGMALNYPRRRFQLVALGVTIAALLHALNDWSLGFFGSVWISILIQGFSLFLFLGYTMSAGAIQRQVRRTPLFRGESMVMDAFTDSQQIPSP